MEFQKKILLSHACGIGTPFPENIVRLIILLKINCLAQGNSGVSIELIDRLIWLYNQNILPIIPSKGSVGASGDLCPLAYIGLCLMGEGDVLYQNEIYPITDLFKKFKITPYLFKEKEALSLINGTQVSTAIALYAGFELQHVFSQAIIAGAFSSYGMGAAMGAFHPELGSLKKSNGVQLISDVLRNLLHSVKQNEKVQDPYSIRCQPQVLGAIWSYMFDAMKHLTNEGNAVSDNPIWVGEMISCGNFHAEICAFSADLLAILASEIGAIAERRIALMMNNNLSGLPYFLSSEPGLNSGMMLAHITSSSLASENKTYSHPASVDSLPTSADQDDHVSMAPFAGMKLLKIIENIKYIIAIETLVALQAIDLSQRINEPLKKYYEVIRQKVHFLKEDRPLDKDIKMVLDIIDCHTYYKDIFEIIFD